MRKLSPTFMDALQNGFLSGLTQAVIADKDLDLYIRDNYVNVYYKGNSLLRLDEKSAESYRASIDPKFQGNLAIPNLVDRQSTDRFLRHVPALKENIIRHGSRLEIEYEQLIIRANNLEPNTNSDIYIVDRQYVLPEGEIDLLGFWWPSGRRSRGQTVAPCVIEIKFALNQEIRHVHQQLARYYEAVRAKAADVAADAESMLRQRLKLGLYDQAQNRLDAMRTLTFARDIEQFQFILVLVDYNPRSSLFGLERLAGLSFADQIRVFHCGFSMWEHNLVPVDKLLGADGND